MKLYLMLAFCYIFFSSFFCFSIDLANIYQQVEKNYKNEANNSLDYALQLVAQKSQSDPDTIKSILNWNLYLCTKTNLLKDKQKPSLKDFNDCYNKITNKLAEIQSSKILTDILDNSTKNLDIYANNNTDDSPYDLIDDINTISNLLFKKQLPSLKSWWKINMKQENITNSQKNSSLNPDNILQQLWDITHNLLSNSKTSNTNSNQSKNKTYKNSNSTSLNMTNSNIKKQKTTTNSHKITFANPNFQIWNICQTQKTSNNQQNNTWNILSETNPEVLKNEYPESTKDFILWNNSAYISSQNWFPKNWENIVNNLFSWNISPKANNKIENKLKNWNPLCSIWPNQILAVCIKLVPSWPRWPVWWTIWANSIEKEIDKIEDVLKDIRAHWIIPSAHGDEALDIDYKHVKLADIFSFNIILSKKPVFKYASEDKKVKKEKKEPLQACPNIPWNLANLYTEIWIKNCSSKQADINKYLIDISDEKKTEKQQWWKMVEGKIWTENTNIPEWTNKEEDRYKDLLGLLIKWFKNLDDLLSSWQNASLTLKLKSE